MNTRRLAGAWLFTTAVLAGCGARSSLEGSESAAQGGSGSTSSTSSSTSSSTVTTSSTTTITTTSTTTITTTSTTITTTSTTITTTSTTTSSTTTSTTTTSTTTSSTTANLTGCADGEREGFLDLATYPFIAACGGGFQVPGLLSEVVPTCNFGGGDDGANPNGIGCSAWDLCALGWHICGSAAEVAQNSVTGCDGAAPGEPAFFATRQSGPGCGLCATGAASLPGCNTCECVSGCLQTDQTANDVFGCGTLGGAPNDCGVLNAFSNNTCASLGFPWSCGDDGCAEAHHVTKSGPQGGGVLCCADMLD